MKGGATVPEVKVIKVQEAGIPGKNNTIVKGIRVTFNVGEHGPFTREFAQEGMTGAQVKAALDAYARELAQIGLS